MGDGVVTMLPGAFLEHVLRDRERKAEEEGRRTFTTCAEEEKMAFTSPPGGQEEAHPGLARAEIFHLSRTSGTGKLQFGGWALPLEKRHLWDAP